MEYKVDSDSNDKKQLWDKQLTVITIIKNYKNLLDIKLSVIATTKNKQVWNKKLRVIAMIKSKG